MFLAIGGLLTAGLAWILVAGSYTRHERVDGILVPTKGLSIVSSQSNGVVTRTFVSEGAKVQRGDVLIEVSGELTSASMGDTRASIALNLRDKQKKLQADLSDTEKLGAMDKSSMEREVDFYAGEMARTRQQISLQQERANSANDLYRQWESVSRGIVSATQILQQKDAALADELQVKVLRGQLAELMRKTAETQENLSQLPLTLDAKRNDFERQLADVERALAENELQRAYVVRSPVAGTVTTILAHVGQAITPQQALMTIVPADSPLQAEVWVPTASIGFIRTGDAVVLDYQAFPFEQFGHQHGKILDISRTAMPPSDVSKMLGLEVNVPCYKIVVSLGRQDVIAYGRAEHLLPGMSLKADIQLDRRRLLGWILDPIRQFSPADKRELK